MNRTLALTSAIVFASIGLAACGGGSDSGSGAETTTGAATAGSDATSATAGGKTVVKVDGKDLTGVDLSNVGCTKQGDRFAIGAGGASGGVGATLKTGNPPTVEAVGITVDGTALAVGPGVGKATVKVDGDRYTISGTASGASMSNPMAGMVSKDFEIVVTCK